MQMRGVLQFRVSKNQRPISKFVLFKIWKLIHTFQASKPINSRDNCFDMIWTKKICIIH